MGELENRPLLGPVILVEGHALTLVLLGVDDDHRPELGMIVAEIAHVQQHPDRNHGDAVRMQLMAVGALEHLALGLVRRPHAFWNQVLLVGELESRTLLGPVNLVEGHALTLVLLGVDDDHRPELGMIVAEIAHVQQRRLLGDLFQTPMTVDAEFLALCNDGHVSQVFLVAGLAPGVGEFRERVVRGIDMIRYLGMAGGADGIRHPLERFPVAGGALAAKEFVRLRQLTRVPGQITGHGPDALVGARRGDGRLQGHLFAGAQIEPGDGPNEKQAQDD